MIEAAKFLLAMPFLPWWRQFSVAPAGAAVGTQPAGYVAEDNVTNYVAEDSVTFYIMEF